MAKRYHHGNLRETLLDAARKLIAEKSPQGFSLAEAAKIAGVSPAAPYRHFESKDELVTALATIGFKRFTETLSKASNAGKADNAFDQIIFLGQAYLNFAEEHKGEYMAMFESGIHVNATADLAYHANASLDVLQSRAEEMLQSIPREIRPPASMIAQHIWAMSHGVVELFARGSIGRATAFSPKDLLESGVRLYLHGLGVK